jgi:hypothetical protein
MTRKLKTHASFDYASGFSWWSICRRYLHPRDKASMRPSCKDCRRILAAKRKEK